MVPRNEMQMIMQGGTMLGRYFILFFSIEEKLTMAGRFHTWYSSLLDMFSAPTLYGCWLARNLFCIVPHILYVHVHNFPIQQTQRVGFSFFPTCFDFVSLFSSSSSFIVWWLRLVGFRSSSWQKRWQVSLWRFYRSLWPCLVKKRSELALSRLTAGTCSLVEEGIMRFRS